MPVEVITLKIGDDRHIWREFHETIRHKTRNFYYDDMILSLIWRELENLSEGIREWVLKIPRNMDFFWIFDAFYEIIYHPSNSRFAICATYGYNIRVFWKVSATKIKLTDNFASRVDFMSARDSRCWYDNIIVLIAGRSITVITDLVRETKMSQEFLESSTNSSFSINKNHKRTICE